MKRPVIGITLGRRNIPVSTDTRQSVRLGLPIEYHDAVLRAGGAPVLLPRSDDPEVLDAVLACLDGLILSGGGDVVSLEYGQEPHPTSAYQDPPRDRMELALTRRAVTDGLPVLGICRGIQLLNVALGGTLIQDIAAQVDNPVQHYTKARDVVLAHTIHIDPESQLAAILETVSTPVNSWHHQAVDTPAEELMVSARARDGVIEAVEAADGRPVIGVQCHPEDCCVDYPLFQRLFDWIVEQGARH